MAQNKTGTLGQLNTGMNNQLLWMVYLEATVLSTKQIATQVQKWYKILAIELVVLGQQLIWEQVLEELQKLLSYRAFRKLI